MKRILGDDYDNYIASLNEPLKHALRVNTLKISVEDFLKISPFSLDPIPWTNNAFYYDASVDTPSKHPFYYAGLYYLQEPSATLPAAALPIEEGDKVLDLCAAPGGKSTELSAKLNGTGLLVSNDISASRIKALQKNLEIFGVTNTVITCESPERLAEHFGPYFDKILIDAPCSGEGMFRKSSSMVTAWEQNGNEFFAKLQREILDSAVDLLAPGGSILYSTCTFDPSEDEEQVMYILGKRPDLKIQPLVSAPGFVDGNKDWCDPSRCEMEPIEELKLTKHLFPHKVQGEGHFVSLIKDESGSTSHVDGNYSKTKEQKFPDEIEEFLKLIDMDKSAVKRDRLSLSGSMLFLKPPVDINLKGLRIIREGVFLGELKKKRFEPSQSFAMIFTGEDFKNTLELEPDGDLVLKYLRGETIDIDLLPDAGSVKPGWTLVTTGGFPLGFGKNINGTLKNKYLAGWRLG